MGVAGGVMVVPVGVLEVADRSGLETLRVRGSGVPETLRGWGNTAGGPAEAPGVEPQPWRIPSGVPVFLAVVPLLVILVFAVR